MEDKSMKVFLGGTCNESMWRDKLIPMLEIEIDYFNPVVPIEEWNDACREREIYEREDSTYNLYCITPKMTGHLSIAEAVDDSNKTPEKVLFCVLNVDGEHQFTNDQMNSFYSIMAMIEKNGGKTFITLEDVANYLNSLVNDHYWG